MRVSALPTISGAIITALKADASLAALIGTRVYQGRAPASVTAPYITILTPSENADNTFGRGGTLNAEQVHVWAANDQAVRVIAAHVMRVLANDTLYVGGGFDVVARDINLVTILRDPDNGLSHGVMRFLTRLSQWPDWPGVWEPTADTVLFAEAFGQNPASQTVVSRIGPNGWLGDSPTTTTNDPTYGSDPARWVFGQTDGRQIQFGDVLGATLNDSQGFTIALPVEFSAVSAGIEMMLLRKSVAGSHGIRFFCGADSGTWFLQAQMMYDTSLTSFDVLSAFAVPAARLSVGRYVVGFSVDRTQPRGQQGMFWVDGAGHVPSHKTNTGPDAVTLNPTGQTLRIGGPHFSTTRPPESGAGIAIARGAMPASWHAGLAAHAQARGWV